MIPIVYVITACYPYLQLEHFTCRFERNYDDRLSEQIPDSAAIAPYRVLILCSVKTGADNTIVDCASSIDIVRKNTAVEDYDLPFQYLYEDGILINNW